MYMFMTAGSLIWRERNPFNSLYLAGTLIILLMPWELFNPGFQLSFGATAGILFFYKMYSRSLGSLPSALKNSLAVTFAAQTAAFPLIYLHMEQFNPAGVITNIFEIPMITLIIMISLACIALSFVSTAAALFFAYPVCLLSKCVFGLNGYISSLKLNFYPENAVIPIAVLIFSALPLINHRFFSRLKAWPIFASCLVSALMLKYGFYETGSKSVPASTAGFRFEQISENVKLVLNLDESDSPVEDTLFLIRKAHPEIKIIEISNSTWNNISVCRLLMNDFIIEECIIGNVESIDAGFTGFLKILQKENIRVTIRPVKGT
jgi:predicted membrane metal-binding protein